MPRLRKPTSVKPKPAEPARSGWTPWDAVPLVAGLIFAVAATCAALRETPTVDEYAHVPAGLLHWRQGAFQLYRNNPPPGKMWVALPLAIDPSVVAPPFEGVGVSWQPWFYGMQFEQAQPDRYLGLMARARLMTIPLALAMAVVVFVWCRQLYGPFPAALATSLLLLSPTVLAHGHLATVDVASAATIVAAVFALRWSAARPSWRRDLVAGGALGLALAVKFSALYLLPLLPLVYAAVVWRAPDGIQRFGALAGHLAGYALAAWLMLNASMGFAGTFSPIDSLTLRSQSFSNLADHLPGWLPAGLPRPYVEGIDALKEDIEAGDMFGYLRGAWSEDGWASYYFIAYAIKESEPIVLLTLLSLVTLPLVVRNWREAIFVVAPPAVLLFIAAALNTLCLGIRYILPAFPFLFVMIGSCFAWFERWLAARRTMRPASATPAKLDLRWLLAAPLLLYALALTYFVYPFYLSYFNQFIGGPAHGSEWLVDSNLDWGQDLYRLPALESRFDVNRWKLLYFGHVDPARYGIQYDLPDRRPEFDVYAVSVNYWKGIHYAVLNDRQQADYVHGRVAWLEKLIPTAQFGSLVIFDLRPSTANRTNRAADLYNRGFVHYVRGEHAQAVDDLTAAVRRDPELAQAYLALGDARLALGDAPAALEAMRQAVRLRGDWDEALNNLAWRLATVSDQSLRDPAEAVQLAEKACRLSRRQNVVHLDTLAAAYAAAGRVDDAIAVCREGLDKATAAGSAQFADSFRQTLEQLEARRLPDRPPGS